MRQVKKKAEGIFEGPNTNPTPGKIDKKNKQYRRELIISNQIQPGLDFKLVVYSWMKVGFLKQIISNKTGISESNMKLRHKNIDMNRNSSLLEEFDFMKNRQIKLVPKYAQTQQQQYTINCYDIIEECSSDYKKFQELVWDVQGAMSKGIIPKLTDFGTQGTYFLEGLDRKNVAVFKASDEEAFAQPNLIQEVSPGNPRGYVGQLGSPGLKPGIISGEGCDREVAAYLVDSFSNGFHNGIHQYSSSRISVPITSYIEFCHPAFKSYEFPVRGAESSQQKIGNLPMKKGRVNSNNEQKGSFQFFVKHEDVAGNFGSSLFSVEQVHKIAILDLRILNCDRNEENILVKKKRVQQLEKSKKIAYDFFLIPIDHGYSFPDEFSICQDEVVWFHWDQIKQPFTQKELDLIESIRPQEDAANIRKKLKFREICLRNFRLAEMFLKMAARNGLTIFEIALLPFFIYSLLGLSSSVQIARCSLHSKRLSRWLKKIMSKAHQFHNHLFRLGSKLPGELRYQKQGGCENDKQVKGSTAKKFKKEVLNTILEEENSTPLEPKEEDSPLKTNASQLKMIKRSISQPSLILMRGNSSQQSSTEKLDRKTKIYSEEFFQHAEWFLSILIEQKKTTKKPGSKNFRERYRSDEFS